MTQIIRSTSLSASDLASWREGNGSADGFALGEDDDTPEQAAARAGYSIVEVDAEGRTVATHDGCRVVICDSHGPWAVAIGPDGTEHVGE